MHESHGCGIKTSISRIKDSFPCLTHKFGQIVSLIHDLTKIQFNFQENNPKRRRMMTLRPSEIKTSENCCLPNSFGSAQTSSQHLRAFLGTFGSVGQKSSEGTGTFSEIPVLIRRKLAHAFDFEKVDRYISLILQR